MTWAAFCMILETGSCMILKFLSPYAVCRNHVFNCFSIVTSFQDSRQ